jgi:ADP-ribose pyrophosphatase
MVVFIATGLKENPLQADDDEFLQVEKIPMKRAIELAEQGEVPDAKSLAALFLARSYLEKYLG